jgi:hypothetical protein
MMDLKQREAFLRQLVAGDLSESDPQVRETLQANPDVAAELASLRFTEQAVRELGAFQANVLAEARRGAEVDAPSGGVLRRAVVADARLRVAARRPWTPARIAQIAAATLLVGGAVWMAVGSGRRDGAPTDVPDRSGTLGGERPQVVPLQPVGEVAQFGAFTWAPYELPPQGWYTVKVFAADDLEGLHVLGRSRGSLTECRWEPSNEVMATWPDRIRWRVEVHAPSGLVDFEEQEATRSR